MADAALIESDLLMWKSPVKSGVVLLALNLLFLGLALLDDFSPVPLACQLAVLAILVGGMVRFVLPQVGEGEFELMPKDAAERMAQAIILCVNTSALKARDVAMWSDAGTTMKALVACDMLRRVAPWISLKLIALLVGNSVLVIPYLLHAYRDVIDQKVGPHLKMFREKKNELMSKIPKYTDVVKTE